MVGTALCRVQPLTHCQGPPDAHVRTEHVPDVHRRQDELEGTLTGLQQVTRLCLKHKRCTDQILRRGSIVYNDVKASFPLSSRPHHEMKQFNACTCCEPLVENLHDSATHMKKQLSTVISSSMAAA